MSEVTIMWQPVVLTDWGSDDEVFIPISLRRPLYVRIDVGADASDQELAHTCKTVVDELGRYLQHDLAGRIEDEQDAVPYHETVYGLVKCALVSH